MAKYQKNNYTKIRLFVLLFTVVMACIGVLVFFLINKDKFSDNYQFSLKGSNVTNIALNSQYVEQGVVATYNGEDISNKVVIAYFKGSDREKVDSIKTDSVATYYVTYSIEYQKLSQTLERTVNIKEHLIDSISIHFLELGNKYNGDCIYIKAGETDILIDAGSRESSAPTISNYLSTYVTDNKLEYVIATHAHQDHIAALVGNKTYTGLLDTYTIDTLIDFPSTKSDSKLYGNYVEKRNALVTKGMKHYTALECYKNQNGASRYIELSNGIQLEFLYHKYYENASSNENNNSVAFMINHGVESNMKHYLFTGDLEEEAESSLVDSNTLPEIDLYKASHHGSYTANNDKLLNVIKPKTVCFTCVAGSEEYTSVKDNTFPSQASINRIAKYTDKMYCTTQSINYSSGTYQALNGNIKYSCNESLVTSMQFSGSSEILKNSQWFKDNRVWPSL